MPILLMRYIYGRTLLNINKDLDKASSVAGMIVRRITIGEVAVMIVLRPEHGRIRANLANTG